MTVILADDQFNDYYDMNANRHERKQARNRCYRALGDDWRRSIVSRRNTGRLGRKIVGIEAVDCSHVHWSVRPFILKTPFTRGKA
jgi:hypothetical protein